MRIIILHYHLFKNAGTSLDRILKANFADAWVTAEFPASGGDNTNQVETWIADTPDAVAYSSHTMMGPLPQVDGVRVIPVMLLRDPVARIRSAYQFERQQDADTWGAKLAREHDLKGYVRARLARKNDRQCRNFQTSRLASLMPGGEPEVERAIAAMRMFQKIGVIGRVEYFQAALNALTKRLTPHFPDFHAKAVRANVSAKPDGSQADDETVTALLNEVNQDDLTVLGALG
jgi:hypothetical protein